MIRTAPTWRGFLRALAEEIDAIGATDARDALLRGVGRRMAATAPLPPAPDVTGLEQELNEHLAVWGWGSAKLDLQAEERALMITHAGLPLIGVAGDPPGTWLSALLEGLYGTWLNALPGAAGHDLVVRRAVVESEAVTLRYGMPILTPEQQDELEAEAEAEAEEIEAVSLG
jgi:hypothetical protein